MFKNVFNIIKYSVVKPKEAVKILIAQRFNHYWMYLFLLGVFFILGNMEYIPLDGLGLTAFGRFLFITVTAIVLAIPITVVCNYILGVMMLVVGKFYNLSARLDDIVRVFYVSFIYTIVLGVVYLIVYTINADLLMDSDNAVYLNTISFLAFLWSSYITVIGLTEIYKVKYTKSVLVYSTFLILVGLLLFLGVLAVNLVGV